MRVLIVKRNKEIENRSISLQKNDLKRKEKDHFKFRSFLILDEEIPSVRSKNVTSQ